MAKKKEEVSVHEILVDISKFTLSMEKYVDSMGRFVMEHLPKTDVVRDGNMLKIKTPLNVSKKMVNLRVSKFIYQSGLKANWKLVALTPSQGNGYQIIEA
jgi:hypothetical protein